MGKFFLTHLNRLGLAPPQHVESGGQDASPGQMGGGQGLLHNGAHGLVQQLVEGKWSPGAVDPHRSGQELQHKGTTHASQQVLPEASGGGGLRQLGLQGGDGLLQYPHAGPQPDVIGDEVLKRVIYVK